MTPTARSKAYFTEIGFRVDVVERWIGVGLGDRDAHGSTIGRRKKRKDFCGFADLIAFSRFEEIAVQSTSASGMSARIKKLLTDPDSTGVSVAVIEWLLGSCGSCEALGHRRLLVQGWKKYATPVDRKLWRPRHAWITVGQFEAKQVADVRDMLAEREELVKASRRELLIA